MTQGERAAHSQERLQSGVAAAVVDGSSKIFHGVSFSLMGDISSTENFYDMACVAF